MRAKQPKEAAYVIQELKNVYVFAVSGVNEVRVSPRHSSKDERHHDEGKDCKSSSAEPAVVNNIGSCVVSHQLQPNKDKVSQEGKMLLSCSANM